MEYKLNLPEESVYKLTKDFKVRKSWFGRFYIELNYVDEKVVS